MNKDHLRAAFKKIRADLTSKRRAEARLALLDSAFLVSGSILSFASFGHEIDTSALNQALANSGRLLLPRMHPTEGLKIFSVTDLKTQLKLNTLNFYEPDPQQCSLVENHTIQTVLVPALIFDCRNHRIGYGKGFYDVFLKKIPHANTIGIGFKEQLVTKLPIQSHDVSLTKVSLF